jgi:hypothetical protein
MRTGKSGQKTGALIVVATVALAAFVAGHMSSTSRPFGDAAFERAYESCVESVALEYKDKVKAEFRRDEQYDGLSTRPSIDPSSARTLKVTWNRWPPTRVDYRAFTERRIECARQGQRR